MIVWFVHRITGAQPLEIPVLKMWRKTTTSLPQVKMAQLLLWSSPEMLLRETIPTTCSLWYDSIVTYYGKVQRILHLEACLGDSLDNFLGGLSRKFFLTMLHLTYVFARIFHFNVRKTQTSYHLPLPKKTEQNKLQNKISKNTDSKMLFFNCICSGWHWSDSCVGLSYKHWCRY